MSNRNESCKKKIVQLRDIKPPKNSLFPFEPYLIPG